MNKPDPHELFPMVFHEVSVVNCLCFEFTLPEDIFHREDVGIHVICNRFKEDMLNYRAWCYIKSKPLMRFARTASLPLEESTISAVNQLIVDHIISDETIFNKCVGFLEWIKNVDYSKKFKKNPHGPKAVERYDGFEFYLPECQYERSDIKLQVIYRSTSSKTIKYNVWCCLDHNPLLGYIGCGEVEKCDGAVEQSIMYQLSDNALYFQEITDFLNLAETIV